MSGWVPSATVGLLGEPGLVGEEVREVLAAGAAACCSFAALERRTTAGSGPTGGGGRGSPRLRRTPFRLLVGSIRGRFSFHLEPGEAAGPGSAAPPDRAFPQRAQLSPSPAWSAPHDTHVGIPTQPLAARRRAKHTRGPMTPCAWCGGAFQRIASQLMNRLGPPATVLIGASISRRTQ
jgi:hypothetical protein